MCEEPIDIVIPWLNPTKKWYETYKLYRENEEEGRIRDLNTIRPAIKSIIKNLPWIRYIWLIVYDEEQIANLEWEELKNEKIKIIYHKDIIPAEFLPNFNSFLTLNYVYKIKELSDCFIKSSDDMIFVKPIDKKFFFKNNKPVHRKNSVRPYTTKLTNTYSYICDSTSNFIKSISGNKVLSQDYHMPCALQKNLIAFLAIKYKSVLHKSFENSKIRKPKNIILYKAAHTLDEIHNYCVYDECKEIKQKVVALSDKTSQNEISNAIKNNHIICINDGEGLINNANEIGNFIKTELENLF